MRNFASGEILHPGLQEESKNEKKRSNIRWEVNGAVEWIRTTTVLLPPAPQAGASASSATTACSYRKGRRFDLSNRFCSYTGARESTLLLRWVLLWRLLNRLLRRLLGLQRNLHGRRRGFRRLLRSRLLRLLQD